MYEKMVRRKYV